MSKPKTVLIDRHPGRSAQTIGVAFDTQEVDAVPHLDYDEPLDWVLTPAGAVRCGR